VKVRGYRFVVQKLHYKPRRSIREGIEHYVELNVGGCVRDGSKNLRRYVALEAKFCTVAHNWPIVWYLIFVTLLKP